MSVTLEVLPQPAPILQILGSSKPVVVLVPSTTAKLVINQPAPVRVVSVASEPAVTILQEVNVTLEVVVAASPILQLVAGTTQRASDLVQVSADDAAPGNLEQKIVPSTGVSFVTLNPGANEKLQVSATGSAVNVGAAAEVFKQVGTSLEFRTLLEGANVTITQLADTLEIASSGGGGSGNVAQDYVFTSDVPVPNQGTLGLFIGLADSLVAPLPMHESSVLLWVSITTDQVDATNDYIVEIFVDGVLLPAASLALPSGSKEEHSATLTEALLAQVGVAVWLRRTAGSGKSDFSNITVSLVFETPQAFAEFSTAFSSAFRKPAP